MQRLKMLDAASKNLTLPVSRLSSIACPAEILKQNNRVSNGLSFSAETSNALRRRRLHAFRFRLRYQSQ
jgi:hypothetical protein